jgi:hypothetical protein
VQKYLSPSGSPSRCILHWYLVYRARNLTEDETQHLDVKGTEVLRTLVSAFYQHGVTLRDGTCRSAFCGEKPHSIVHGGRNFRCMGRCKYYNTVAPENRHKQTKRKTHKTNNHFTAGMSILQSNMDEEPDDSCLSSMTKKVVNWAKLCDDV